WGIVVKFHPAVDVPASGTTREKALAMTQACADVLGAGVREHTADWHMLQRVFLEDLDPARLAAQGVSS
ncbi:MAG TPA: phosphatidylinositol mannoside acyltransferase, partial [Phycicoccus sp.]